MEKVVELRKQKKTIYEIAKELNYSVSKVYKICIDNGLNNIGLVGRNRPKLSEETKKKMSDSKKLLYKNNPDKHNWKSKNKFISKPCEEFKKTLGDIGMKYISELTPLSDRFFSIDIALIDKKVGIEINGNQHYNKDGTLKDYYQERHNLIEDDGWKLYEIHFSVCYNKDVIKNIIKGIVDESKDIFDFNYDEYLVEKLNKKKKVFICKCGGVKKDRYSNQCGVCQHISQRKVDRPSKEQLIIEVEKIGYSATGRKYGVSDNTIRKWVK